MKVLFIGDIHGKSDWITYVTTAYKEGTEVVFMGDYVDSIEISPREIEQNLLRIIAFKKKSDKRKDRKCTLLLGNHDYAYMMSKFHTSGYKSEYAKTYYDIFNDNWNLFDLAWGYWNRRYRYTLVTHAGLTLNYWKNVIFPEMDFVNKILGENTLVEEDESPSYFLHHTKDKKPLHEILNIFKDKFSLLWKIGHIRTGWGGQGSDSPSLIWADISELEGNYFQEIDQIVGHSSWHSPEIITIEDLTENKIYKIDGVGKEIQRMIIDL